MNRKEVIPIRRRSKLPDDDGGGGRWLVILVRLAHALARTHFEGPWWWPWG
jgi:hypothetical protein